MAVGSGTPYNVHTGNGSTTVFAFEFTLLAADDLQVTIDDVLSTDYTISGLGDADGGSITFGNAPANGVEVIIERVINLVRETDYQDNGDLLAGTLDDDFDRLWMAIQGVEDNNTRSLRAPFPETLDELPEAADRADKLLSFDSDGNPSLVAPTEGTASALALDLAATSASTKGSGMVGFDPQLNYAVGTIGQATALVPHVMMFDGVTGDGVADDTAGLQAALDFIALAGGVINAEGYQYRLTSKLTIPSNVKLKGCDWLPDPSNLNQATHTALYIDWGAGDDDHAVEMSSNSGLEGFTFYYPDQVAKTAATPTAFGYSISTPLAGASDNISLKNITLFNSYKGIRMLNSGRFRLENIQGNPLSVGLNVDGSLDVCYLSKVHFWNFYTQSNTLETWVSENGTAFDFARVDQLFGDDLFGWNYNKCFVARDDAWISLTNILCDKANEPLRIEGAANVQVSNFTLIANAKVKPAIWVKAVDQAAQFSNGRVTAASSVGYQVDDGALVMFDNVDFQGPHAAGVTTSNATIVQHSGCKWVIPPMGGANVVIDGIRLPHESTAITLPTPTESNVTAITGGYRFDLSALAARQVDWDIALISQRNSLYVLSFDYALTGDIATWYFKFLVQDAGGTNTQVSFAPLAPLRLHLSSSSNRVRIPFFVNHGRAGCLMKVFVEPTVAVSGAKLELTNFILTEQESKRTTDAQVQMMMRHYNLDAYGMGQTLFANGPSRRVIVRPESGVGRTGAAPNSGTWQVGDVCDLETPTAGASPGSVCTTAGTPGTWKAKASLAA